MAVDGYGLALDFIITGGQGHESKIADELVSISPLSDYVIADRGMIKKLFVSRLERKVQYQCVRENGTQ